MNTNTANPNMAGMRNNRMLWAAGLGAVALGAYLYYNRAHSQVISPETKAHIKRDLDEAKAAGDRVVEKGKEIVTGRKVRARGRRPARTAGIARSPGREGPT